MLFLSTEKTWRFFWLWLVAVLAVFFVAGETVVFFFTTTFALLYGGLVYKNRFGIRKWLRDKKLAGFFVFAALAALVSALEETWVYFLGGTMLDPVLWIDLYFVVPMFVFWQSAWYFLVQKYAYGEKQVLLLAGFNGFLFEAVGNGSLFSNTLSALAFMPLSMAVYMAIIVLPLQCADFTGKKTGQGRILLGAFLPYLAAWPAGLFLFFLRILAGF